MQPCPSPGNRPACPQSWSHPVSIETQSESESLSFSHVQLSATPWTVAHPAPLSMEFPRQEYWSGFPFPSPEDFPDPGIEPGSPALQADSLPSKPHKGKI